MTVDEEQGPVRVGRFEWERLMMLSDLPEQDRFRLLALGIFMDGQEGRARPGNAGLAALGPHEETWKKLLRRTVKAGWLVLLYRGGARRGPGGTTVRRASVYGASVPREAWKRRAEILAASPFRTSRDEGSPDPLKEAPRDFVQEVSKEAPEASFKGDGAQLKEAPGSFLPDSSKEAPEASFKSFEGSPQGLPHQVPTPSLSYLPTGDSAQASKEETTDAFTICQPLINAMTDAGLTVSWQMQADDWHAIARVLERAGVDAMVKHALGVKSREPIRFARYYLRAGWLGLPPKSTKRPTQAPTPEKPPHCGDIDCDPISRTRDQETPDGLFISVRCPDCHPDTRKTTAA